MVAKYINLFISNAPTIFLIKNLDVCWVKCFPGLQLSGSTFWHLFIKNVTDSYSGMML